MIPHLGNNNNNQLNINVFLNETCKNAINMSDFINSLHIQLKDLRKIDHRKKIAFLFGSEASGLSNSEISYSNYVLKIPCNSKFKSLNLSHSVIIIAQHVFELLNQNKIKYKKSEKIIQASKKDIKSMLDL